MERVVWSIVDDADALDLSAAERVDAGLGDFNLAVSALRDSRPLACFAQRHDGTVIGGVVGRTWGACAEVLQLWVDDAVRRQGIGGALMQRFERLAIERGCTLAYLDTFSFQAPAFYRRLGWHVVRTIAGFAPGVEKHSFEKRLGA